MSKSINLRVKETINGSMFNEQSSSFKTYMSEIRQYGHVNSRNEEIELASRIQNGDEIAFNTFYKKNLLLVVTIARCYCKNGVPFDDLIQEGNIALMKAVRGYSRYEEFRFSSFACPIIRKAIVDSIEETGKTIRRPHETNVIALRINKVKSSFEKDFGRTPCEDELAEIIGTSVEVIKQVMGSNVSMSSMDKNISDDSEDGTIGDLVAGDMDADAKLKEEDRSKEINFLLKGLDNRSRTIVKMYFGIGEDIPCSVGVIADRLKICDARVNQLLRDAMTKLKRTAEK